MLHGDLIRGHLAPAAWALHAACFVYRSAECCGVITQLKLKVSRLLSPGPDRLTSTNQAMKYSPGQEVRKCETGRDKQGVMKVNKRVAYSKKLVCFINLFCLLTSLAEVSFLLLDSVSPAHVWAQYNLRRMGLSSHRDTPITVWSCTFVFKYFYANLCIVTVCSESIVLSILSEPPLPGHGTSRSLSVSIAVHDVSILRCA